MRKFYELNTATTDENTGVFLIACDENNYDIELALRREGGYVSISMRYGPIEMALRPRFNELNRVLGRLRPVNGLHTTRQIGTAQANVALGLREDGSLIIRPTIVADATGLLCFNLILTDDIRAKLFEWLEVSDDNQ